MAQYFFKLLASGRVQIAKFENKERPSNVYSTNYKTEQCSCQAYRKCKHIGMVKKWLSSVPGVIFDGENWVKSDLIADTVKLIQGDLK